MHDLCHCEQKEVLEESRNMIPDCDRRLKRAYVDLQVVLVRMSTASHTYF